LADRLPLHLYYSMLGAVHVTLEGRGLSRCYTVTGGGEVKPVYCKTVVYISPRSVTFFTSIVDVCVCSAVFHIPIHTLELHMLCDTYNSCFNTTSRGRRVTLLCNFGGQPSVMLCYMGGEGHKRPK